MDKEANDMGIKAKIKEMERISKEIEKELKTVRLYFTWSMTLHCSEYDRAALGLNVQFQSLREKLYDDLIKAGSLSKGSGSEDKPEPDGR
jgi:hypothetical protein